MFTFMARFFLIMVSPLPFPWLTTYSNLKPWFDSWKRNLVDLGFATIAVDDQGKIDIPDNQLSRILNLDESCLSLNGNERRGGRPSVVFYDPNLPNPVKTVSKSSVSLKFIGGSNALG